MEGVKVEQERWEVEASSHYFAQIYYFCWHGRDWTAEKCSIPSFASTFLSAAQE